MTPFQEHERRLELDRTYYRDDPPESHGWRHPDTGQVFGLSDLPKPRKDSRTMAAQEWLDWLEKLRPNLRNEQPFEIACGVLTQLSQHRPHECSVPQACDALADLIPEQREFWLRVGATYNERFVGGLTALFESEHDIRSTESE